MSDIQNLSSDQLRKIISIKEQIEQLQGQLTSVLGDSSQTVEEAPETSTPTKRKLSSSHRRKLIKALAKARKIRWAKAKAEGGAKPAKKADRRGSPAVRAKLAAAARARWKKAKAAGKARL